MAEKVEVEMEVRVLRRSDRSLSLPLSCCVSLSTLRPVLILSQTGKYSGARCLSARRGATRSAKRARSSVMNDSGLMDRPCTLFSIPPELREQIYLFVFSPSTDDAQPIDVLEAEPPNSAVLRACKQLNAEARHFYRVAYRDYWTSSSFILNYHSTGHMGNDLVNKALLPHKFDISHITDLRVVTHDSKPWTLVHPNGGWRVTMSDGRIRHLRLRIWTFRERLGDGDNWRYHVDPTRTAWDSATDDVELPATCDKIQCKLSVMDQIRLLPTTGLCDASLCPRTVPVWD